MGIKIRNRNCENGVVGDIGCDSNNGNNKYEEKELCKHHTCGAVEFQQQPDSVSIDRVVFWEKCQN